MEEAEKGEGGEGGEGIDMDGGEESEVRSSHSRGTILSGTMFQSSRTTPIQTPVLLAQLQYAACTDPKTMSRFWWNVTNFAIPTGRGPEGRFVVSDLSAKKVTPAGTNLKISCFGFSNGTILRVIITVLHTVRRGYK